MNKQRATDQENFLLVDAWNALKTNNVATSKEGITFYNLSTFLHVINYIFPGELLKHVSLDDSQSKRPFGHLSSQGLFYVLSPQETFKIHIKYQSFVHNKKFLESLVHSAKKQTLLIEDNQRFNYTPALNNRSRCIAEN